MYESMGTNKCRLQSYLIYLSSPLWNEVVAVSYRPPGGAYKELVREGGLVN